MNRYPTLYPYARYRDEDDAYERHRQREVDAQEEAERIAEYADARAVIPAKDATNG